MAQSPTCLQSSSQQVLHPLASEVLSSGDLPGRVCSRAAMSPAPPVTQCADCIFVDERMRQACEVSFTASLDSWPT